MNWQAYPNFSKKEFECSHTGECEMHPDFMERLQRLRTALRQPIIINSGYRSPTHPIEAKKTSVGSHTTGRAVDVKASGHYAFELVELAIELGFTRIGVSQKGDYNSRFIHLDDNPDFPHPVIWSY